MPERVFLHVGSPKTGTTFLQNVMWSGRQVALDHGLLLPLGTFHDHFLASVDLREQSMYEQFPPRAIGIWERLAEEARAWKGDVLVSHELFAGATAEQAATAVRSFGDADVHVIVTARDLERQIPAEWQEHIKHRSTSTFTEFVHDVRTMAPDVRVVLERAGLRGRLPSLGCAPAARQHPRRDRAPGRRRPAPAVVEVLGSHRAPVGAVRPGLDARQHVAPCGAGRAAPPRQHPARGASPACPAPTRRRSRTSWPSRCWPTDQAHRSAWSATTASSR